MHVPSSSSATTPGEFLPGVVAPVKQRADGATLACLYALLLTMVPASLVLKGIPLAVSPAMAIGLVLGVLWFCTQLTSTLGAAKGRNAVRTALFLFASSQLATYGVATYGYLPSDELAAADRTLITLVAVISVGLAACDGVRTLDRLDRVLKMVVVGATFMAGVGVLQFTIGFDLTAYLQLPGLKSVGDVSFVLERSNFRRPAGTAGHPIEFGVVCAMIVPLALHYALRALDHALPQRRWWFCLGVLAMASVQSISRSAVLGLAVAAIILIPAMKPKRRVRALIGIVIFAGAMRVLSPGLVGTLFSLFTNIGIDPSAESRRRAVDRAGSEIAEHLILGRGMGTYLPQKYGWLDNQYLGTLVQNGVVGLITLLLLFFAGWYAAYRIRKISKDPVLRDLAITLAACIAVPGVSAATFDLLGFGVATGLTFLLVGCLGALLRIARARATEGEPA